MDRARHWETVVGGAGEGSSSQDAGRDQRGRAAQRESASIDVVRMSSPAGRTIEDLALNSNGRLRNREGTSFLESNSNLTRSDGTPRPGGERGEQLTRGMLETAIRALRRYGDVYTTRNGWTAQKTRVRETYDPVSDTYDYQ